MGLERRRDSQPHRQTPELGYAWYLVLGYCSMIMDNTKIYCAQNHLLHVKPINRIVPLEMTALCNLGNLDRTSYLRWVFRLGIIPDVGTHILYAIKKTPANRDRPIGGGKERQTSAAAGLLLDCVHRLDIQVSQVVVATHNRHRSMASKGHQSYTCIQSAPCHVLFACLGGGG